MLDIIISSHILTTRNTHLKTKTTPINHWNKQTVFANPQREVFLWWVCTFHLWR